MRSAHKRRKRDGSRLSLDEDKGATSVLSHRSSLIPEEAAWNASRTGPPRLGTVQRRRRRSGPPAIAGSQTAASTTVLCTADGEPDHVQRRMHAGHVAEEVKDG